MIEDLPNEEWRDIPDCEGLYKVSNLGRVKNVLKQRLISQSQNRHGYLRVNLKCSDVWRNVEVHSIIANAFILNNYSVYDFVADHIDNDKKNNKLSNLQLISSRKNCSKDKTNKTSNYTGVSWCRVKKRWRAQIYINKKNINLGRYKDEIDAHNAYQEALKKIGEH